MLAVSCIFALYTEASAKASDVGTKPKDVKEPKEIKDSATASKDVKDAIKNAKDAKKKKDCAKPCPVAYDPVCGHDAADPASKPVTFGTLCAMEVHNCEMGKSEHFYSIFFRFFVAFL